MVALAGVVGVVSLTEARSSTLIGVFISVTTIPAASDIGVSLAFGSGTRPGALPCSSCSTSPCLPLSRSRDFLRSRPSGGESVGGLPQYKPVSNPAARMPRCRRIRVVWPLCRVGCNRQASRWPAATAGRFLRPWGASVPGSRGRSFRGRLRDAHFEEFEPEAGDALHQSLEGALIE